MLLEWEVSDWRNLDLKDCGIKTQWQYYQLQDTSVHFCIGLHNLNSIHNLEPQQLWKYQFHYVAMCTKMYGKDTINLSSAKLLYNTHILNNQILQLIKRRTLVFSPLRFSARMSRHVPHRHVTMLFEMIKNLCISIKNWLQKLDGF